MDLGYEVPDYETCPGQPAKPETTKIRYPSFTVCDNAELFALVAERGEIEATVKLKVVSAETHSEEGSYDGKDGSRIEFSVKSLEITNSDKPKPAGAMKSIAAYLSKE